ncbi:hypothetical protein R5H30_18240 [Sulfitobacter sp. D35]|uniref:hypothetical protein n=1 Tax=Sulfitobacter sp. D35 TaxID=3083252 RepID=UPI00296ED0AF|nr:hypothetical protein [Sulfitobacter sp. D35]MDW4499938.1 hypothetical protein [Sulfitobacter sp. D35]
MKVLLLEDDPFLQFDIADTVSMSGHEVIGPFSNEEEALARCRSELPDAAVIDFNLGEDKNSSRLADFFIENDVRFVITTGYSIKHLPERLHAVQVIEKPFTDRAVLQFLDGSD